MVTGIIVGIVTLLMGLLIKVAHTNINKNSLDISRIKTKIVELEGRIQKERELSAERKISNRETINRINTEIQELKNELKKISHE